MLKLYIPCLVQGASETAFKIQNYQKLKRMKIKIGEEEKKGLGTKKKNGVRIKLPTLEWAPHLRLELEFNSLDASEANIQLSSHGVCSAPHT